MNESCMTDHETSKPTETDASPVSIQRDGDAAIVITWTDDVVTNWTVARLRKACPCATCREKKRDESPEVAEPAKTMMLPVLSAAEAKPMRIDSMTPVGSYAYSITFSDGHSSGIYPFALLRENAE